MNRVLFHKVLCPMLLVLGLVYGPADARVHAADVAAIMSADVEEYADALEGFKSTIRHRIVVEYDMEGDFERGGEILSEIESEVKPDLILAVGVWALQLIMREGTELPVVYAMVLNPPSVIGSRRRNITGASLNVPVERSLRLLEELGPKIRRVGVIFNASKTGYLVREATVIAKKRGLELSAKEIVSPKEAVPALESLNREGIDALWILPDDTVLAPAVIQHMLLFSYRQKIPLLGLSQRQAEMGALLSLSFASSEDIGKQAAELANRFLEERDAARIPYTVARRVNLTVNLKAAAKLGLQIPQSILGSADMLIE